MATESPELHLAKGVVEYQIRQREVRLDEWKFIQGALAMLNRVGRSSDELSLHITGLGGMN